MLTAEVFNYLSRNGVSYYFVNIHATIKEIEHRTQNFDVIGNENVLTILSKYNDYLILKDIKIEDTVNIIGGRRVTKNNPDIYNNSIYCYGPCTAFGAFASDDKTIESFLQLILNEKRYPYRVVNCGSVGNVNILNNDLNSLYSLMDTKFIKGDIVIHFGHNLWNNFVHLAKEKQILFSNIFNTPPFDKVRCFNQNSEHINETGNHIVAEVIFNQIKSELKSNELVAPFFERIHRKVNIDDELNDYLSLLSKERTTADKIGAIVMNCNPFTKGHMYLIEQALKQIDFLYVFVVEEDLSEFTFKDRFAIVQENCKTFDNVKVLPSGKYMISTFTFADYFKKDAIQDQNIIPAKDVRLFGSVIAPCLNIKFRFVGEEPLDNVTRQYNETMKQILGDYGVQLIEIPRLTLSSGEIVNATKVRQLIKENKIFECKPYLTEESYEYIINLNK